MYNQSPKYIKQRRTQRAREQGDLSNEGKPWTMEQRGELLALRYKGVPLGTIRNVLKRSYEACSTELSRILANEFGRTEEFIAWAKAIDWTPIQ